MCFEMLVVMFQQNADLCENVDWKDDHARGGAK